MATHKLLELVTLNLRDMTHLGLGHFVVGLADGLASHAGYQAPGSIPHPLLQPDALRQVGMNYIAVTNAADGHDRFKVAARDALRPITELHAIMLVQWASIRSVAEDNPTLIQGLGLVPRIPVVKSSVTASVFAPQNVRVKHGKTGAVLISTDKVPKARTYDVGICQGDPSLEESWSLLGPFDHCRNIELTGLEPGKVYYFRVRCFGAGAQSTWSAIVTLRVL